MAIKSGTTLTRGLVSETSEGINQSIAKAFEDNIGYDRKGSIQRAGGSSKQSTIDFKWRGTRLETTQKFAMDLSSVVTDLGFTGNTNINKVSRITVGGGSGSGGTDTLRVSLGGVTGTFILPSGSRTPNKTAIFLELILKQSKFNNIIQSVSINGTVLTIHYQHDAGNIIFPTSVVEVDHLGRVNITWTTSETVVTQFANLSKSAVLTAEIETNNPIAGTVKPIFITNSSDISIPEAESLSSINFGSLLSTLISAAEGVNTVSSLGSNVYTVSLDSQRGVSEFAVKFILVQDGVTTNSSVTATISGTNTVTYESAQPETYGTFQITLQDPSNQHSFSIEVTVPEDSPITDIEKTIKSALQDSVIGITEDGAIRYASEFINVSIGSVTNGTDGDGRDVHEFTLTLDWVDPGVAATPTVIDTGLVDKGSDFSVVTDVAGKAGSLPTSSDRIPWKHVTTSATLQPGGDTTHFATLVFLATADI